MSLVADLLLRWDYYSVNFHFSNSESVRDVQFLPKNNFSFTSVSENGNVQLWDVRKGGERPFLTFTAHSGPVFSMLLKT